MDSLRLRVLLIEDDEDDYILVRDLLSQTPFADYDLEWAASFDAGMEAMEGCHWDICLLDYRLGEQDGLELLCRLREMKCRVPVILLTGRGDHEVDLQAMKAGAADYLVKGQIDADLLERSMRYSMERKCNEEEREKLVGRLEEALASIKVLKGLLPICPCCKKIRDTEGAWRQLEAYITAHSEAGFSPTICPECEEALRPLSDFASRLNRNEIPEETVQGAASRAG